MEEEITYGRRNYVWEWENKLRMGEENTYESERINYVWERSSHKKIQLL
jgi:hypothetical protein